MRDTSPLSLPSIPCLGWDIWCCKVHTFDIEELGAMFLVWV